MIKNGTKKPLSHRAAFFYSFIDAPLSMEVVGSSHEIRDRIVISLVAFDGTLLHNSFLYKPHNKSYNLG